MSPDYNDDDELPVPLGDDVLLSLLWCSSWASSPFSSTVDRGALHIGLI